MKNGVLSTLWLLAGVLAGAAAFAHHSTAMFDYTQSKKLSGVVRSFQWGNPHNYVQLMTTDSNGAQQEWAIEAGVPSAMTQLGWSRNTLKSGDKVTVVIAPMKDGSRSGSLKSVMLPNGKELTGIAAVLGAGPGPGAFPTLKRSTPKSP